MIIQTKRLTLRPFIDEDIKWYYEITQNDEFKKRLIGLEAQNLDDAKAHIDIFKSGNFQDDFYYVIENKQGNAIGIIIAVRMSGNIVDVSYFLLEEYRHNGYMLEALKRFIQKVKAEVEVYTFRMVIDEDNISSLNVVKKINAYIEKEEDKYLCFA